MDFFLNILFTVFALSAVLVLAWFVLRGMSQVKNVNAKQSPIDVLSVKAIGQRERLIVVKYDNTEYLLGVSTAGVSVVDKKPAADAISAEETAAWKSAEANSAAEK